MTSQGCSSPIDLCYQAGSGDQEEVLLFRAHLDQRNLKNVMVSLILTLNSNPLNFLMSFFLLYVNTYSSSSF